MPRQTSGILFFCLLLLFNRNIKGQPVEFHGQAAGWATVNSSGGTGFQAGARYIPQLLFDFPVGKNFKLDAEISADSYLNYTYLPDTSDLSSANASFYRAWLRFSGKRFELRAGLQKINFGSASILRPLMWFDRIDPRDPLQLTKGVFGVLGKYYFRNNANIWLWVLYGNSETKGWESIPSNPVRPEFGGRIQLPISRGEIALTYHNREGEFPAGWPQPVTPPLFFPENRVGLDMKLDLGIGLWFEGFITQQDHPDLLPYTRSMSIGADYTIGIGNGLNITAEHLLFNSSEEMLSGGEGISFTGLSLNLPLSVITRTSAIIFYDWKNNEWYRFANLSFTFDKLAINLIGFWNPEGFRIFNYDSGPNMFAGAGGQVMVVFNH